MPASDRDRKRDPAAARNKLKMFVVLTGGHRMYYQWLPLISFKEKTLPHLPGVIHIPNRGANGGRAGLTSLIVPARALN